MAARYDIDPQKQVGHRVGRDAVPMLLVFTISQVTSENQAAAANISAGCETTA